MNAIAKTSQMTQDFDELKIRLKTTWMSGEYDVFSRFLEKDADRFYRRLNVKPGARRRLRQGSVVGAARGRYSMSHSWRAGSIFISWVCRLLTYLDCPSANDPTNFPVTEFHFCLTGQQLV